MKYVGRALFSLVIVTIALVTLVGAGDASAQGRSSSAGEPPPPVRAGGGPSFKDPAIVPSMHTAASTVARTTLQHEWVDIAMGTAKLRAWIEYPQGNAPAPVVLVMQHEAGLDAWSRGVADQLAREGFITIAPDLFSGFGPNGGNYDSFKTPDEAMRIAGPRLTPEEAMRRAVVAWNYAMKLPRANGKSGVIGAGTGGSHSFRFAGEVPQINGAVVFYGAAPPETVLAKIKAPVIGFYGGDDFEVTPTVESTKAAMAKLGKQYDVHVYPWATRFFLFYQPEGGNTPATLEAWPRAVAFLKERLR